ELRFGVRVHLLAGRLEPAAKESRAFAAELEARKASSPDEEASNASRAALARCLTEAIDARAPNRAALERLREEPGKPAYPACAILFADLHEGKARLDVIHAMTSFQSSAREVPMRWLDLLEAEADRTVPPSGPAPYVIEAPSLFVINPSLAIQALLPGVER